MVVDPEIVEATLVDIKSASAYYAISAFANLDKFSSLAKYETLKKTFLEHYQTHDFKLDASKMSSEACVCARGLTKADSLQSLLDVWDSIHLIEDEDVQDNVYDTVARPFEQQIIIIKNLCTK